MTKQIETNEIEVEVTNAKKEVVVSDEVHNEVVDMFNEIPQLEFVSPYRLASYLSRLMGKKINPQMMYNYHKNNLLVCSLSSTQKLQVSKDDSIKFCEVFVTRNRK